MPTYEYRCRDCGHEFEQMQKITADPIKECPECSEQNVQRLVSASSFHLKGSGWYKTDYASSTSGSTKDSTTSESKPKGTAKSDATPTPKKETKPKTDSA